MAQYYSENSAFFAEKACAPKQAGTVKRGLKSVLSWQKTPIPDSIHVNVSLLQTLREHLPESKTWQDNNDIEHSVSDLLDSNSNSQSSNSCVKIQTKNFYKEKITDQEYAQINERVSLQQRQFAEHELREKLRKCQTIREVFDYLSDEEIDAILQECENNEEKAICRLSEPGALAQLRKTIALKHNKQVPLMIKPEQLTQILEIKRQPRTKLGLDAALKHFAANSNAKPDKAFEGWSAARIKSYKLIEQNPNSYFYRFNEPGEEQKTGQWTEDEKKLFFDRLKGFGAEGQWGLFSRGIPGRVGYQCSNYYRYLLETAQVKDDNYVIDLDGKPHFTVEKICPDGTIEKRMRTHNKIINQTPIYKEKKENITLASKADTKPKKSTKRKLPQQKNSPKKARRRHRLTMTKDGSSDSEIESYDNDASGNFMPRNYYRTRADKVQLEKSSRTRCPSTAKSESEDCNTSNSTESQDAFITDYSECLLPGFIDPITLDQIEKPAISKYGHVMGYDSWLRCLSNWQGGLQKNVCPITKQTLTKRDLVLLTSENLHIYKDKIANL